MTDPHEKKIEIEKASVCFMSQDIERGASQLESIEESRLSFEMVPFLSAQRNATLYSSFSQMINEAIDDTECEFMIFINPKATATAEDLNRIAELLSSGYCFASLFGFAFFGTSKKLIREIGMLDEKFQGGEYEDNDFLLRMIMHGKAIWWGQDWSKYQYFKSACPPERGSSLSFFWKKWRWTGSAARRTIWQEKSISRRHSKESAEISRSWMDASSSWGEGPIWNSMSECALDRSRWACRQRECDIRVSWSLSDGDFRIEMLCDSEAAISFFLTTEERIPLYMHLVYQNTWHSTRIPHDSPELRIYLDGSIIYMNRISEGESWSQRFRLPASIAEKE